MCHWYKLIPTMTLKFPSLLKTQFFFVFSLRVVMCNVSRVRKHRIMIQHTVYLIKTEAYISAVEISIFYHEHTAVKPVHNESSPV